MDFLKNQAVQLASSAGNSVISVTSISQSSVISMGSLCSVWAGGLRGRVTGKRKGGVACHISNGSDVPM